jgi:hypothetical protein
MSLSFANDTTSAHSLYVAPLCEMILAPTAILQQELSALLDDRKVDRPTSQELRCDIDDRDGVLPFLQVKHFCNIVSMVTIVALT